MLCPFVIVHRSKCFAPDSLPGLISAAGRPAHLSFREKVMAALRMRIPVRMLGVLVGTAAIPALVEPFGARLALAALCISAAAATSGHWMNGHAGTGRRGSAPETADAPPVSTHQMVEEMRGAIEQTERAVLDIGDRFMAIAGRARAQLGSVNEVMEELAGHCGGGDGRLAARIDAVARETAFLADDINRIIVSLQFQDITRQRLERVVGQLQELERGLGAARRGR